MYWFISLIYIINVIIAHRNNRLIHLKQQNHHHYPHGYNSKHHHHHHQHSHIYPNAKIVDYDKLLEWREERDIYNIMDEEDILRDILNNEEFDEQVVPRNALRDFGNNAHVAAGRGHPAVVAPINIFSTVAAVPGGAAEHIRVAWPTDGTENAAANALDAPALFTWDEWKRKWDTGLFKAPIAAAPLAHPPVVGNRGRYHVVEAQVARFRRQALDRLLFDTNGGGGLAGDVRTCFDDMGSTTPKSDLDFTLVRWDDPSHVVDWLSGFYTQCHDLFGNYPMQVFDMTFYVATSIVSTKPGGRNCYGTVLNRVRTELMQPRIDDAFNVNYALYGVVESFQAPNADKWLEFDVYMQYWLINRRLTAQNRNPPEVPGHPPHALRNLLQLSKVYYNLIDRVQNDLGVRHIVTGGPNGHIRNENKLFIHGVLLWMNYYSDESYISNVALQQIWFKQSSERGVVWTRSTGPVPKVAAAGINPKPDWAVLPSKAKRYLFALDHFAFILEYKIESAHGHGGATAQFIWFLDKISKYMKRVGQFLDQNVDSVGGGGIAGWNGGVGTIDEMSATMRRNFNNLYAEMTVWADDIRGQVPLGDIPAVYVAAWGVGGAPAPGLTAGQRARYIINKITVNTAGRFCGANTCTSPDNIWKHNIEPIMKKMKKYFEDLVRTENKNIINMAMKRIKSGANNHIRFNGAVYNAAGSQLPQTTEENVGDGEINFFKRAARGASGDGPDRWMDVDVVADP